MADIDPSTVALLVNGHTMLYAEPGKPRLSDFNDNGVPDLTVKFDRAAVSEVVGTGTSEVAITGLINDMLFQASDILYGMSLKDQSE